MSEIKKKILQKKKQSNVFKYSVKTDRYGSESYGYSSIADFYLTVMWLPVSSEVEIAEYGERVNEMMQACLFTDENVIEKDRVEIDSTLYNVVSVKKYPSYRLLLVERVN